MTATTPGNSANHDFSMPDFSGISDPQDKRLATTIDDEIISRDPNDPRDPVSFKMSARRRAETHGDAGFEESSVAAAGDDAGGADDAGGSDSGGSGGSSPQTPAEAAQAGSFMEWVRDAAKTRTVPVHEAQLFYWTVAEHLDFLDAAGVAPELPDLGASLLTEISRAVSYENAWRMPKKGEAAANLSAAARHLNEMKKGMGPVPKQRSLSEATVIQTLLHRYEIVVLDLAGESISRKTAALALYQATGVDAGLYTTSEASIFQLISQLDATLPTKAIQAMIEKFQAVAPMVQRSADPRYIPVNNGIFDFEEKTLLDFSPEFVFLNKSPVDYRADAENPVFTQPDGTPWDVASWIDDLSDDEGVPELLWEVLSAVLRPNENFDQAVFLHSSKGNNGKGTYCQLARNLVGPRGTTSIPMDRFAKPFALGALVHAQAIITDENPVGAFSKDLGDFKAIVTGDEFTLERKYRDPISATFSGQVIQCVNDFPRSADKSASYSRRQLFIPFKKWFGGDGIERKYIKQDYLHRAEVLEYVLFRALHMDHTRFSQPAVCQELLAQYQQENDPVVGFWAEMEEEFVWDLLPTSFLYQLFCSWFRETNPSGTVMGRPVFLTRLQEHLDDSPDWDFDKSRTIRVGSQMDAPELLIARYKLENWYTPSYSGSSPEKKSRPTTAATYRGVRRVTPLNLDYQGAPRDDT